MRYRILGGVLVAVALSLAACSSGSSSTPVSPATQATSAPPQSAGQSSAPPASSPAASPNAAGLPKCTASDLRVKLGSAEGAAGSIYQTIDFTNTSSGTCTLYGYPGVSLLTGDSPGVQIGAAADRDHTKTPALVTLAAGDIAAAVVQIVQAGNYPAAVCDPKPAAVMRVYTPDETRWTFLPYTATGCASTSVVILRVSPVAAG